MFIFTLRYILSGSRLFLYEKNLNKVVLSSSFLINTQKALPCLNYNLSVNFSSKVSELASESEETRKESIEKRSQEKVDKLLMNPEYQTRKELIQMEMEVSRQNGEEIPDVLRPRDWQEILQMDSEYKRKKYLKYLFIRTKHREREVERKIENNILLEEIKKERCQFSISEEELSYGIGRNSLLRRITNSTMNKLWIWNNLKSIMFGNQIVIDCSYDSFMNVQELRSCARQIMRAYANNRQHNHPFHMWLCNVDKSNMLTEYLYRYIPTMFDSDFPITITSESYLTLFEKNKLVYLSSDSNCDMIHHDPDLIYILGAYVDKGISKPISLARAKEHKIASYRLPIDKYVRFGEGSRKALTLDQVTNILLDSQTSDWNKAFKHLPRRKLFENRLAALESRASRDLLIQKMNLLNKKNLGDSD